MSESSLDKLLEYARTADSETIKLLLATFLSTRCLHTLEEDSNNNSRLELSVERIYSSVDSIISGGHIRVITKVNPQRNFSVDKPINTSQYSFFHYVMELCEDILGKYPSQRLVKRVIRAYTSRVIIENENSRYRPNSN